ncbi:peptide-methionine (S)-S-oxide reductase [Massilia eurypsychrophila]|jgi:peptide-methionine (S)-S-oxide reductase|uniref:Peptide methionine sulfoxide reductase MsrA n=2 Tax=Massilia eurypsychrophila TaxID=1485217 RepID=A0A2G8TJK8_9BURK|nr:peptide-methionine (S)-S-oxide reductase [Massilia eurypsychrophila]
MKITTTLCAWLAGVAMFGVGAAAHAQASTPSATAIFASGCFWCTESDFEKLQGVVKVESGYTSGRVQNPTYEQVSAGATGHTEAVRVVYDPSKVSYQQLLAHFWRNVDPTVKDRQFCDVGSQYRSGIYYLNEEQRQAAQASLETLQKSRRFERIYTEIVPASTFYLAETYHQDYAKKNPIRYTYYRTSCGRDARLKQLWD